MAITYSTSIQDRIALLVYGVANTGLADYQKVLLDGTWTTGALSSGVAKDALQVLNQFGQWNEAVSSASAPPDWEQWFIAESAYRLAIAARPDRIATIKQMREEAMEAALLTYSRTGIADNATAATTSLTDLRQHVIASLSRMRPLKYVPVEQIDRAVQWAMNNLWNRGKWSFRRRMVTATIATDESVTITAGMESGETIDDIVTNALYLGGTSTRIVTWAKPDEMSQLKSLTDVQAGVPRQFRINKLGTTFQWKFFPVPDISYTATFEVLTSGPTLPTSTPSTSITQFPPLFIPTLRDLVLAKVMQDNSIDGATERMRMVDDDIGRNLTFYDDVGEPDAAQSVRDVYGDFFEMSGDNLRPFLPGSFGGAM